MDSDTVKIRLRDQIHERRTPRHIDLLFLSRTSPILIWSEDIGENIVIQPHIADKSVIRKILPRHRLLLPDERMIL